MLPETLGEPATLEKMLSIRVWESLTILVGSNICGSRRFEPWQSRKYDESSSRGMCSRG